MKLSELTPEIFGRALALYLKKAYPNREPPPKAQIDAASLETAHAVLELFKLESRPNPGGEDFHHYVLRLGNAHYPHMKLVLAEILEPDEWVWAVDTHDQAPIPPEHPDWPRWQELRALNLETKAIIERSWRKAGIPTARAHMQGLPAVDEAQSGPLILVVDDEIGMRRAAINVLCGAGYRVVEAASGFDAIERFIDERPDLVLMDYEMPHMDGPAVCTHLRVLDADRGCHTPILMATAGMVNLSETKGADGFLVKPYQRRLLLKLVKVQLEPQDQPEPCDQPEPQARPEMGAQPEANEPPPSASSPEGD